MHSRDVNWKVSIIASIDTSNEKKYQIDNTTTYTLWPQDYSITAWYMYVIIIIFFIEKWTEHAKFNYIMIVNHRALFYNLVLDKNLKKTSCLLFCGSNSMAAARYCERRKPREMGRFANNTRPKWSRTGSSKLSYV